MGKDKINLVLKLFPLFFFLGLAFILFKPYFLNGQVPIPADILIGHYYPWKDEVWGGRTAGYPIKNFILYDGIRQTLPWRMLAIDMIKSGKLPLWNPYIFSGMPLLGNLQAAAFYPLNLLFLILPFLDAWSLYVFLQPVLAGVFTFLFTKTILKSNTASLFAGVCYAFSMMMMNHLEFGIDNHTALWLPLALLAVNKVQEGSDRWFLILILAISMSLLGGYPPPAIYNLLVIGAYVLFKIRPFFSRKLLFVILSLILSFGLTAPQILPAFELATKVVREKSEFGVSANDFFLPKENLIMIVAPDFFGHPSTGNFFSRVYHVENQSIGIIGFLFVIYALATIFKKKESRFWATLGFFPLFLIVNTSLGRTLGSMKIPLFSLVTPMRMSWIVVFAFSVLAGIGLEEVIYGILKNKRISFFSFVFPIIFLWEIIFLLWIITFLFSNPEHTIISQKNLFLPTLFFLFSTVFLVLMARFPKIIPFLSFFVVLLSSFELIRQGNKYNSFINKTLVFPRVEILSKIQESNVYRTVSTNPETLPVNSNIPYRISMIDGYASLYDGRYGQMVKIANFSYPATEIENYPRIVFQTETNSKIIDLLGVKYVLSLGELNNPNYKFIIKEGKSNLYENLKVFPKAFLVQNYSVAQNNLQIVNRMLLADLKKEVVLEEEPNIVNTSVSLKEGKVDLVKYEENETLLKVFSPVSSLLVLNDAYDSGWKATVDGEETKVLRADYDLRAIVVPEGNHLVKFYYRPFSFELGIFAFITSFLLLFFILVVKFIPKFF